MMRLIDVHCHVVPDGFPLSHERCSARWPCLRHEADGTAMLLIGNKPFRALDNRSWDVARRIVDMDRDEVTMQVLSPMPELLSYWLDVEDTAVMGDHVNGAIAAMVAARPDRFAGPCRIRSVPLANSNGCVINLGLKASKLAATSAESISAIQSSATFLQRLRNLAWRCSSMHFTPLRLPRLDISQI
jgi:Amidohydrolase